jgi:hypothetical protein
VIDPAPPVDASKRAKTLAAARRDKIDTLWYSPTNDVGDNGWAVYNTITEYLDWESPVKCADGVTDLDRRMENQFDGIWDDEKSALADLILADA